VKKSQKGQTDKTTYKRQHGKSLFYEKKEPKSYED
jgi:hypothetical protein